MVIYRKSVKEIKVGDDHYKSKGLVKIVGHVEPRIARRYERAAKRRGWSKRQFNGYWLTIKAPKLGGR